MWNVSVLSSVICPAMFLHGIVTIFTGYIHNTILFTYWTCSLALNLLSEQLSYENVSVVVFVKCFAIHVLQIFFSALEYETWFHLLFCQSLWFLCCNSMEKTACLCKYRAEMLSKLEKADFVYCILSLYLILLLETFLTFTVP